MDASTTQAVIGLIQNGACAAERCWPSSRGNPGILVGQIQELLEATATPWHSLDAILVGCGPGQYAGLRVSVTVAQTLQLPAHAQVAGICSAYALRAAAITQVETASIIICGDARRNHIWYYHWNPAEPHAQLPTMQCIPASAFAEIPQAEGCIVASPDYERLHERLLLPANAHWIEGDQHPTASAMFQAASQYPTVITAPDIRYVHPPVATVPPKDSPA